MAHPDRHANKIIPSIRWSNRTYPPIAVRNTVAALFPGSLVSRCPLFVMRVTVTVFPSMIRWIGQELGGYKDTRNVAP